GQDRQPALDPRLPARPRRSVADVQARARRAARALRRARVRGEGAAAPPSHRGARVGPRERSESVIRRPVAILVLLTGPNLLNYLDRIILSAVLPDVQDELSLSGFVAGALGTIFLLGYFLTSPIFGALGDRGKRKGLITIGVLVWSAATFATGLAHSAGDLIL